MVEDYTKLSLTDEIDILPAMSGLAKQFQQTVQSQYLAGLAKRKTTARRGATQACRPGTRTCAPCPIAR